MTDLLKLKLQILISDTMILSELGTYDEKIS